MRRESLRTKRCILFHCFCCVFSFIQICFRPLLCRVFSQCKWRKHFFFKNNPAEILEIINCCFYFLQLIDFTGLCPHLTEVTTYTGVLAFWGFLCVNALIILHKIMLKLLHLIQKSDFKRYLNLAQLSKCDWQRCILVSWVERVTLNFLLSLLWAFVKLDCACVCWTRVDQWVTVARCGSELWAFLRVFLCVLIRQRGQPSSPMRAPTHRTNEGIVCASRKHWPGDWLYKTIVRTIELTVIFKFNY